MSVNKDEHFRIISLLLMPGCVAFGQEPASKQDKEFVALKAMRDFSFVLGNWRPVEQSGKPAKYIEDYSFERSRLDS